MLRVLKRLLARFFPRRPPAEGVPPVGVRAPKSHSPRGLSGAVAVMEPDEAIRTTAVAGRR